MRDALEDHLVDGGAIEVPAEINPKDRHVVRAALAGAATIVATSDRPAREEVRHAVSELRAMSLDEFALSLFERSPDDVSEVVNALAAKRTNPPIRREPCWTRCKAQCRRWSAASGQHEG
jgi:N-acetylglucosamine kinase-like BadF-type ATPase